MEDTEMKKYIKPTMIIANLENETILAGSDLQNLSDGNGGDALANQRGLFDWDEDEE